MKAAANTTPIEDLECYAFVKKLEELKDNGKVILFSHIPNETYTRSWKVRNNNKAKGVRKGIPDYCIVTKSQLLFVEMKRTQGGVLSVDQLAWIEALNDVGVKARVCYGSTEAIEFVEENI
jgi:hypothetical protein